jgi:lambda repressor-like predicted transcriptional regulator
MPGAPKTSDQIKQAIVLRDGGYSLASIVERTGISASTLARHFKRHSITKGSLNAEAITEARQQLLTDGGLIDQLKHEIAAAVVYDISHVKQLREAAALLLEELMADRSLPAHYKARAVTALATTLSVTQAAARKALRADELQPEASELPSLTILEITPDEIQRIRDEQTKDGIFDVPDIEIIDEGVEQVTDD